MYETWGQREETESAYEILTAENEKMMPRVNINAMIVVLGRCGCGCGCGCGKSSTIRVVL